MLRRVIALFLVATGAAAQPVLVRISEADAVLQPAGGAPLPAQRVTLRHRWDDAFPGRDGRVVYRITLPPAAAGVPRAVLLERVGNQVQIQAQAPAQPDLDGAMPLILGRSVAHDASKRAHLVALPPQATHLRITADVQALRGGGLSPLLVGPREMLEARLAWRQAIDQVLPAMYVASLSLMGGLALSLWWRQRDALYGSFGLAALCGTARPLDRLLADAPLPWPLWGALLAMAYGCQLVLILRFALQAADSATQALARANLALLGAVVLLAALSFATGTAALWTAALGAIVAFGVACLFVVVRSALQQPRASVMFVLAAGVALLATGLHDLLTVRLSALPGGREPLTPHALFLFVLLMASAVVARYSGTVAAVKSFNRVLAERIAERESQLTAAFEALGTQRDERAAAAERQRIMRDIHDGVGSQLVGLRSLVHDAQADPVQLAQHVEAALDELRMAVDSMHPSDGDLSTVLATLRYRLQPRLDACAIRVVWDVAPLQTPVPPSPHAVLQVQRILLEAFTNVIRHAKARTITVHARVDMDGMQGTEVRIELRDDGVGLPPDHPAGGHGLANMHARASAIGAQLQIDPAPGGGTRLQLRWPLAPAPSEVESFSRSCPSSASEDVRSRRKAQP